ncbi:MAG: hypothetical protein AB1806_16715 [Acidobacteriota bacterium]
MAMLAPAMHGLTGPQQQLFLLTLALVDRIKGSGLDLARDDDVAEAAGAMAATYQTEARGLIYEQRPASLVAQRLAGEIRAVYDQLGRQRPSGFASDAALVLSRLQERIKDVAKAGGGNPSAFLELAARIARLLASDAEEEPEAGDVRPAGAGPSPIILP